MGVQVTFLRDDADKTQPAVTLRPVTLEHKAAIITDKDQTFAFIVRGDRVERVAVRVGGNDGDRLEILAGLSAGDRVVMTPPPSLASGALILVKQ